MLFFLIRFDHLNITNENNKSFGMICGQRSGMVVNVTGKYALLIFHSDAEIQKEGFLLYFTTFPLPSKCKKYSKLFIAILLRHAYWNNGGYMTLRIGKSVFKSWEV